MLRRCLVWGGPSRGFQAFEAQVTRGLPSPLRKPQTRTLQTFFRLSPEMNPARRIKMARALLQRAPAKKKVPQRKTSAVPAVRRISTRSTSPVKRVGKSASAKVKKAASSSSSLKKAAATTSKPVSRLSKKKKEDQKKFVQFRARVLARTRLQPRPALEKRMSHLWMLMKKKRVHPDHRVPVAVRVLRPSAVKRVFRRTPARRLKSQKKSKGPTAKQQYSQFRKLVVKRSGLTASREVENRMRRLWSLLMAKKEMTPPQRVAEAVLMLRPLDKKAAEAPPRVVKKKKKKLRARKALRLEKPASGAPRTLKKSSASVNHKKVKRKWSKKQQHFLAFYRAMLMTGKIPRDSTARTGTIRYLWASTKHLQDIEARIKLAEDYLAGTGTLPPSSITDAESPHSLESS